MKYGHNLKHTIITFALLFSLSYYLPGCSDDSSNPLDLNLFSLEDDKNLGAELDAQIRATPAEYPIYNNDAVRQYVQDIIDKLLTAPEVKYEDDFDYTVTVIDKDVVNAFAAPGGYIYVYTGLLKFLDNEATLAAVMAHEIGHVENRHSSKRLTKTYGASVLLGLLLGDNPDALTEMAANILSNVAFMQNSQADEYEADESSFDYLLSTNTWYPGAIEYFFDKVGENEDASWIEELLSTHPMPGDRIDAVKKLMQENNVPAATEANLFTDKYTQFKQTIQ